MKILTFMDYYLPGFKAGGPIRTLSAMVKHLPSSFCFYIVTRNRDHTERKAYPVPTGTWTEVDRAKVLYLSRWMLNWLRILRLVRAERPDIIYLNSLFSRITIRLLFVRWLGWLRGLPVILAPRGEFSAGALRIRRWRKKVFLFLASRLGFFDRLVWQASTEVERGDILRALGEGQSIRVSRNIAVASDLVALSGDARTPESPRKRPGAARFVFLSRVSPMKNVRTAIELVGALAGEVSFDIYGPTDDEKYGEECRQAAARARPNVRITWHGSVQPAEVAAVFGKYDFFILPTLGENFGHVILEALGAGCPVVLSDRTPWKALEADGAGWVIPLEAKERWMAVLSRCVEMDAHSHWTLREGALGAARRYTDQSQAIAQNIALFEEARSICGPTPR